MNNKRLVLAFIMGMIIMSCNEDDTITQEQTIQSFLFEDGFETQSDSLDELFPSNGSRWTGIQQVNPSTTSINEMAITKSLISEGENSLRLFAFASDKLLSKIDIEKAGFTAFANDRVIIKADFYISGNANIEDLLLIDLECCSCWDVTAGVDNQCPGIRLQMSGGNDFLSIERGKIAESTIQQTTFQFPRDEWVTVQWELTLAENDSGMNRLLINGTEVIHSVGVNLPNPQTFRDIFLKEGIDFNLQEPVFYERVQIGATANPTSENIELFVDNFSLLVESNIP